MVVIGINRSALFPHLGQRTFEMFISSTEPTIIQPAFIAVNTHPGGPPPKIYIVIMTANSIKKPMGSQSKNMLRRRRISFTRGSLS